MDTLANEALIPDICTFCPLKNYGEEHACYQRQRNRKISQKANNHMQGLHLKIFHISDQMTL